MKGMIGGESLVRASRYTRWFHEGSCEGRSHSERRQTPHTITHLTPQHNQMPHANKEGDMPIPVELSSSSAPDLKKAGSAAGGKAMCACGFPASNEPPRKLHGH